MDTENEAMFAQVHENNQAVLEGAEPVDYAVPGFATIGTWGPSRLPDGSVIQLQVLRWYRRPDGSHAMVAWWPGNGTTLPEGMLFAFPAMEFALKAN